jgi:hypothetical protein
VFRRADTKQFQQFGEPLFTRVGIVVLADQEWPLGMERKGNPSAASGQAQPLSPK